ncbi:unnamed protein product [Rotaria magnacalcarata]|uniref:Uncharacterized protein n=1 Tax=Rotaria magnacalcarata TaxID=392030 RepID=A0A820BGN3_9BILA|nr:unnamed protein product [Rotaria magnacalcarata]
MLKETKASTSISYLTDKQSSSLDTTKVKSDTQIDNIVLQSNNSSIHTEPFADYTQQSLSLTTSNNTPKPLQKTKKKNKKKEILMINMHIATPTEKEPIEPLILSTHSSKFAYDKSQSSNSDCPTIDQLTNEVSYDDINLEESYSYDDINLEESYSYDDIKSQESSSNVVEKQRDNAEPLFNDNLDLINFTHKLKLSQKIDNIYETNATQLILNRLRAGHNLDVPYTPTNRMSSKNYSTYTENLFNRFEKYLKHNYEHLWKKINQDILISTQPEQMEFDILGFSFEHSSKERTLIESPNLQAISARSSYNYLKPFHENTVIIAEVTTSFLSFHNDDLSLCEKKKISSSLINIERKKSSFKLFQKLLQLERGLAFILLYYGIQLEYVLVVLFGRGEPLRSIIPQFLRLDGYVGDRHVGAAIDGTTSRLNNFVNGFDLKKDIVSHMPHLRQFNFHIRSIFENVTHVEIDAIRRSFLKYQLGSVDCAVNYFNNNYGRCQTYSLPFKDVLNGYYVITF